MKTLTLINGNKKPYTVNMPKIILQTENINDAALAHITENTGLTFRSNGWSYEAQPTTGEQIAALLLTYNFKTRYYNNWQAKNTLYLKFDHNIGFDVDSICFECCQENHINTNGLKKGDRLAC